MAHLRDLAGRTNTSIFDAYDDAEIVGEIAEGGPVFRYLLAQEIQDGSAEVVVGRVAAVVATC